MEVEDADSSKGRHSGGGGGRDSREGGGAEVEKVDLVAVMDT